MKRFVARALIVVAAILGMVFAQVAPASAAPGDPSNKLVSNLAELWTTVLETPLSDFPVDGGCWNLGNRTVAPFFGGNEFTCTVKAGTKIFVAGYSTECSDIPGETDHPEGEPPYTEKELGDCAEKADAERAPNITVTLDDRSLPRTDVRTPLLHPVLPADNILGAPPEGDYHSVAHGSFVVLLAPLTPGTHTIFIEGIPKNPDGTGGTATTTIKVEGPPPAR
jgi:hypothetical protein